MLATEREPEGQAKRSKSNRTRLYSILLDCKSSRTRWYDNRHGGAKLADTLPPAPSNLEGELLNLEGELLNLEGELPLSQSLNSYIKDGFF